MLRNIEFYKTFDLSNTLKVGSLISAIVTGAVASPATVQGSETKTESLSLGLSTAVRLDPQKSPVLLGSQAVVRRSDSENLSSLSQYLPDIGPDVRQSRGKDDTCPMVLQFSTGSFGTCDCGYHFGL
jgi:hypothetical protein